MSAAILIRAARAADADSLPALERSSGEAFRSLPDLAWIADDDVMSAEQHAPLIAAGGVWVAERDAGVVGFISAEVMPTTWHVWQMAVRRDAQGRGVGRALLECMIDAAREAGAREVTLTTFRDVAWNAPFYARSGFGILSADAIDERLRAILANEIAHRLPGEQRCAMKLQF